MKKIFLLLFISIVMYGQNNTILESEYEYGSSKEFYFSGTLIDSGTIYSDWFQLDDWDAATWTTYPLNYMYEADSVVGDATFNMYIQRKFTNMDADSVQAITTGDTALTSTTAADEGTLTLGNSKAPRYRLVVNTTTGADTTWNLKLVLYTYKRDE